MLRYGTYSIVARDPDTFELGVAVQSHAFSVGSVVTWARAGVGAVAVQSIPSPDAGPKLLDALEQGIGTQDALRMQIASDEERDLRQIGLVDARGRATAYTGAGCIRYAGDVAGPDYSCQANMMATADVWPAMARGYERAEGPFAERLLAALDAAEAAGGDVRGRQSAAILVVPAQGDPWTRSVDLRVEDHADPLGELRRLLVLRRAYELGSEADELVAQGRHAEASERYARSAELAPDNDELLFWAGLSLVGQGDVERGMQHVRRAVEINPRLRELLGRLGEEIVPGVGVVREALDG